MLVSCCLVQASEGMLSMHDHLRDLAYRIVREGGGSIPERTHLLGQDAEDALKVHVRARCH